MMPESQYTSTFIGEQIILYFLKKYKERIYNFRREDILPHIPEVSVYLFNHATENLRTDNLITIPHRITASEGNPFKGNYVEHPAYDGEGFYSLTDLGILRGEELKEKFEKQHQRVKFMKNGKVYIDGLYKGFLSGNSTDYYFLELLYHNYDKALSHQELYDHIKQQRKVKKYSRLKQTMCNNCKSSIVAEIPELKNHIFPFKIQKGVNGYILSNFSRKKNKS